MPQIRRREQLRPATHADIRRSGTSCTPEQRAQWIGLPATRLFPLPGTAARASPPWECTHVQRSDGDFFLAQGWVASENLLRSRTLGEHVGHQVHGDPRALEYGRSAHDLRIANHHLPHTRQVLQLILYGPPGSPDLNQQRRPVRDWQLFGFRRSLNRFRDFSAGAYWQQPQAFRFELQVDQLLLCEQPPNASAASGRARTYEATVDRFVNRSQR